MSIPPSPRRPALFRRTKTATASPSADPGVETKASGKGRPTPTRREAEAAARARAKAPTNRKEAVRRQRELRSATSREIRAGMKAGDERFLPPRDKGPVRRFVRDFVDARLCMAEFSVPLLFSSLIASSAGYAETGAGLMNATLLVVVLDSLLLRFRLRRELRRRFPDESLKGTTFYAYMRSLQLRFLRLPKPQVRLGQPLPERY